MLKKELRADSFLLSWHLCWLVVALLKLYEPTKTFDGITVPKSYICHTSGTLYEMLDMGKQHME